MLVNHRTLQFRVSLDLLQGFFNNTIPCGSRIVHRIISRSALAIYPNESSAIEAAFKQESSFRIGPI